MREHIQSPTTPINGHAPEDEAACVAFVHETATASPDSHFTFRPAALAHLDRLLQSRAEALARCQRYEREVMRLRPAPNEVHDLQPGERAVIEQLGATGDWDAVSVDREDAATVVSLVQRLQGAISNRMRPSADDPIDGRRHPLPETTGAAIRLAPLRERLIEAARSKSAALVSVHEVEQMFNDLELLTKRTRLRQSTESLVVATRELVDRQLGPTNAKAVAVVREALVDVRRALDGRPPLPELPEPVAAALAIDDPAARSLAVRLALESKDGAK